MLSSLTDNSACPVPAVEEVRPVEAASLTPELPVSHEWNGEEPNLPCRENPPIDEVWAQFRESSNTVGAGDATDSGMTSGGIANFRRNAREIQTPFRRSTATPD